MDAWRETRLKISSILLSFWCLKNERLRHDCFFRDAIDIQLKTIIGKKQWTMTTPWHDIDRTYKPLTWCLHGIYLSYLFRLEKESPPVLIKFLGRIIYTTFVFGYRLVCKISFVTLTNILALLTILDCRGCRNKNKGYFLGIDSKQGCTEEQIRCKEAITSKYTSINITCSSVLVKIASRIFAKTSDAIAFVASLVGIVVSAADVRS